MEKKWIFILLSRLPLTMGCDTKSCTNKQSTDINTKQIFCLNSVGGNTNAVWTPIMCGKCIPSMCATVKKVVWMQLFFLSIHNNHTSSKTFRYYLTNTNADFADQVALNSCYHHSKFGRFWQHFYLENVNTKVSAKSGNVQVNFPEYILSCAGSYQCILHSYNFWTQSDQNFTRKMQNSSLPLDISWIWK